MIEAVLADMDRLVGMARWLCNATYSLWLPGCP